MQWHPYAKLFPMLPDEQIELLADDIRANGLRTPILVDRDERIIDGRNRSAACVLANVEPVLEVFAGSDREILKLVCSLNIHRRHLSESQRADIGAKIANMPAHATATAKRGKADVGETTSEQIVTQSEAADLMNVSRDSVIKAARVQKSGINELKDDVTSGKVSVTKAAKVAKLAPAEQQKARAAGYKEKPVEPPSCALRYAEQALAIMARIREDDENRFEAFELVSDWIETNWPAAKDTRGVA